MIKNTYWRFFTYHQLRIDKYSTFTAQGILLLNPQIQFYELSNFGALNLSLNRSFLKRKLTLTLNGSDVLFTLPNTFSLAQGQIVARGQRRSDTRRVGINLRYNFGLRKKEERTNMFNLDSDN